MTFARRTAARWLSLASLLTLLAFLGIAGARTTPERGPPLSTPVAAAADPDRNATDPDWGAPKKPLPDGVKGWAPNQDTRKPKKFPHYGRVEFDLCDLPVDAGKGGLFKNWSDDAMRRWCRGELNKVHGMTADYTNHELVEEVDNGKGGTKKVLAVYKTWKDDHASSGRPKMYHPRNPNMETYFGGIAQLKALDDDLFKKAKPKKKRVQIDADGRPILAAGETVCAGEVCEICDACAETHEDVAPWCGEGGTCEVQP